MYLFNPFLANIPILYPLKTSENQRFSGVFRDYKMGTLARNGLMSGICLSLHIFTGRLFTSLALLLRSLFCGVIKDIVMLMVLVFRETAKSIIVLAIRVEFFSELSYLFQREGWLHMFVHVMHFR